MPVISVAYNTDAYQAWSALSTAGAVIALISLALTLSLLFRAVIVRSRPRLLAGLCALIFLAGTAVMFTGEIGSHRVLESAVTANQNDVNESVTETLIHYQADPGDDCLDNDESIICGGNRTVPVTASPAEGHGARFVVEPSLEHNDWDNTVSVHIDMEQL